LGKHTQFNHHMKLTSFLLLTGLLLSGYSYAQVNGNYNYSLALRGFSILQAPKIFNQNSETYVNNTITGGMIKFNDNQVSYRVSGNYLKKSLSFNNTCMNCELAHGRVKDYAFKIGMEKNFNYARIQPYFAIDIGYRFNQFKGLLNTVNYQQSITSVHALEDTKSGGTASSVIGFKINPVNQVSLFIESGIEFYYAYIRQETTSQDASAIRSQNKFNRGEFLLNPISAGIQIHLGNKN